MTPERRKEIEALAEGIKNADISKEKRGAIEAVNELFDLLETTAAEFAKVTRELLTEIDRLKGEKQW